MSRDESQISGPEPEDLDGLVLKYLPQLRMYLRLNAGNRFAQRDSLDDLAQSVCREVLEQRDRFEHRGEAAFRSWLFRAAETKIIDKHRYHGAQRRDAERETTHDLDALRASFLTASQHAMRSEDLDSLERAFTQLPDEYRALLIAAKIYGQPLSEIAARNGEAAGAVRMRLQRAKARLAWLMREQGREEQPR